MLSILTEKFMLFQRHTLERRMILKYIRSKITGIVFLEFLKKGTAVIREYKNTTSVLRHLLKNRDTES